MATAFIEGISLWAPSLPGWPVARAAFRGERASVDSPARRPSPELLPAAERRRAPDTVALGLEVATQAVAQSGRDPRELLSVFTSAHGDLAINDYMCSTLAVAPRLISPTKFLNSVHNATAGYWGIGTGCMQPSTAVSAFDCSFAAGLLEALTQCAADAQPVLLVGCDIAAAGALASTNDSRGALAVALVLAPLRTDRAVAALDWSLEPGTVTRAALRSPAAQALASNALTDALPLFEALADGSDAPLLLRLSLPLLLPLSSLLALRLQRRALT
jgi:Beta-ketoacyl synthase, N-terminal domain